MILTGCVLFISDSEDDERDNSSEDLEADQSRLRIVETETSVPEKRPQGRPKRKWMSSKDQNSFSKVSPYGGMGDNSFGMAKPWSSWSSTPGASTMDQDARKAMQEAMLPDFEESMLGAGAGGVRGPSDFFMKVMEESGNSFTPATYHKERKSSLMDLLTSSTEGCAILAHYKKFNALNNRMRGKLSDIIMRNELAADPNRKIDVRRFVVLSRAISVAFPTEDPYTYYVPYTNLGGGKKSSAKGKLCDKYHNLRRTFRESGLIPPRGAPQAGEDYDKEREFDNLDYHNIYA
nr:PREDICTED: uncharacterized protein LOC109037166 [Bemisia tabaci]